MQRASRLVKAITLAGTCGVLWAGSGGCLPEDWAVDLGGKVVGGLVVSALNLLLTASGLQI